VSRYLGRLSQNLRGAGLPNELLVMQGNGGMTAAGTAVDLAVHTIMSGPAAERLRRRGSAFRPAVPTSSPATWADQFRCLADRSR